MSTLEKTFDDYSPEQKLAIAAVKRGNSSIMVNAVAGSGKTTLIQGALKVSKGDVSICAYNKSIADEQEAKVNKIKGELFCRAYVGTVHRFGNAALRKVFKNTKLMIKGKEFKQDKVDWLMDNVQLPGNDITGIPFNIRNFVRKAYTLSRQWGAGISPDFPYSRAEAWYKLVEHFDLSNVFIDKKGSLPDDLDELIKAAINATVYVLKMGEKVTPDFIDFEDMIWIPLRLNLKFEQYDKVFVDECQDLNVSRRIMIKRILKHGGQAIFVGDPHQAIYGFTGADAESFEKIKSEFGCKEFGLTFCFRCSKAVVKNAQKWVPHIQYAPNTVEGSTPVITEKEFYDTWVNTIDPKNDAILCRNNAPLVSLYFKLLKYGIPCKIEGKDISEDLIELIGRFEHYKKISTLVINMTEYRDKKTAKYMAAGKELEAGNLNDSVDAILAVIENLPKGSNVYDLVNKIRSMFSETAKESKNILVLTSGHKSKGREWHRTFWWGSTNFSPSKYARQDWQKKQEDNLCYVMQTRAMVDCVEVILPA